MGFHKDQNEANMHEPKGVTTAAEGTTYIADGAGGGAWANPQGANVVIINSLADFPTAAGGTITLEDDKHYELAAAVSTPDFFTMGVANAITGNNAGGALLTYSGTGAMFVGVDKSVNIHDIRLTCPNAKTFDFSETGGGGLKAVDITNVSVVDSVSAATFTDIGFVTLTTSAWFDSDTGINILGTGTFSVSMARSAVFGTAASSIGFDITGTTGISSFDITNCAFAGGATSIGFKGDAGSVNFSVGTVASVTGTSFDGVTTALSGVSQDDVRLDFQGNSVTPDTMPDALTTLSGNATATVLSVGVPTLVLGTWVEKRASHFTTTAAGRITYDGERPLTTPMTVSMTIDPASGTNKSIRACIALNGTAIADSSMAVNISAGDPKQLTIPWQLVLSENDFLEVFVENETDSVNVTVIDATFMVR